MTPETKITRAAPGTVCDECGTCGKAAYVTVEYTSPHTGQRAFAHRCKRHATYLNAAALVPPEVRA